MVDLSGDSPGAGAGMGADAALRSLVGWCDETHRLQWAAEAAESGPSGDGASGGGEAATAAEIDFRTPTKSGCSVQSLRNRL
eukprot:3832967-Pyramimonas_sp.AAC.1